MKNLWTAQEVRETLQNKVTTDVKTRVQDWSDDSNTDINDGFIVTYYFSEGSRLEFIYQGSREGWSKWTPSQDAAVWFTLYEANE